MQGTEREKTTVGDTIKMKRPPFPPPSGEDPSGCVMRDERGNAVWQWKDDDTLNRALVDSDLTVAEDDLALTGTMKLNIVGSGPNFDPYAGALAKDRKERPRKKDLRELSKWIEMKRRSDGTSGEG